MQMDGRLHQIDGLRAVAMTMVVAQHCGLLPIGWTGVWLFFVISGYVITRGLLSDGTDPVGPVHHYQSFMQRRSIRIIPVYLLYLSCASLALLMTGVLGSFRDMPFLLTFTYNYQMMFEFVPGATRFSPFGHLWTLSVEQQFYLFFPLLFLCVPRRRFSAVAAGLILIAPLVRALFSWSLARQGTDNGTIAFSVYAASFCQFDAFLLGALIADNERALRSDSRYFRWIWNAAALVAVAYTALMIVANVLHGARGIDILRNIYSGILFGQGREILLYISIDLIAATVLIAALRQPSWLKLLATPTLSWVGKVSYGAYLFHALVLWMLFSVLAPHEGPAPLMVKIATFITGWSITVAIASLSYRLFERPLMVRAQRRPKFAPASLATLQR